MLIKRNPKTEIDKFFREVVKGLCCTGATRRWVYADVAEDMGIQTRTVYDWMALGIPSRRLGEVLDWLNA